ncbi:hypothetical protein [Aurantiacibacter marinus]|uniref:hypothetical protein n=1 Tax=Aurantiacibacter marinus TaxID=874156 RepID=UPI000699A32F|nr:hypothetical protein [Aurantiacibacter marinus]
MIDYFSIALTHGLIMVAAWRLLMRDDLDTDTAAAAAPERPWLKNRENLAPGDSGANGDA